MVVPFSTTSVIYLIILLFVAVVVVPRVFRFVVVTLEDRRRAEARAARALAEVLSAEELAQLEARGFLVVPSRVRAGRTYHVPRRQGMISVFEGGVLAERLCVGAINPIPDADAVLLHKLMIEGNEEEYLQLANHFAVRPFSFPF